MVPLRFLTSAQLRKTRNKNSRGAALVETALVLPILVLMALGTLEFGYLFMHTTSIANASAVAARAGGATKTAAVPDSVILEQVKSRKLAINGASRIVIYRSQTNDGKVPSACANGSSVANLCNVYTVNSNGTTSGTESAWPATARKPGIDYLGVAIQGSHGWLTGVFGAGSLAVADSGVVLLEPSVADLAPTVDGEATVLAGEGPSWSTDSPGSNVPAGSNAYTNWFFQASYDGFPGSGGASGGSGGAGGL